MRGIFAGRSHIFSKRDDGASVRGLRFGARALVVLMTGTLLVACTTTSSGPDPQRARVTLPEIENERPAIERGTWNENGHYAQPNHMDGRQPVRVALLLPLGHQNEQARALAASMRDAAELAIFRSGREDLLLMTKDTHGTVTGAMNAAREAIDDGAEIILGPLFADNVTAIAPIARQAGVSIVAFSSDSQVAGPDVYLLGFTPEQEVERVAEFAMSQGYFDFAAMIPYGDYGSRVNYTFGNTINRYGGMVVETISYDRAAEDFRSEAGALAHTYGVSSMRRTDEDGNDLGAEMMVPENPGFTAVLLPEGGTALRLLAPSLPYNDIDNRSVRFLGTGLWDDERLWREPALDYGWFAAPDPGQRERFEAAYEHVFGDDPHRLASVAYDAVTLAANLASGRSGDRFNKSNLTNPSGFAGVDGIFRFRDGGVTDRGLAVLEVRNGEIRVASPAPSRFGPLNARQHIYERPVVNEEIYMEEEARRDENAPTTINGVEIFDPDA